jgi:geranylgeranylglycerol-phosphate geranylgeranyltransferase
MNKPAGLIRLMRPVNCLMMGFAVIVGAALATKGVSAIAQEWQDSLYGFITGFMLTAASMGINDYYDRDIDAVNEPKRPIPSGAVKPQEAVAFALVLTALGLIAAFLSSAFCFVTAVIAWVVFVAYTTVGKRSGLPGNFLVSICVAIPLVYGSIVATDEVQLNVWLFATIAFLSNTGREITKGIVDVEGDKSKHVKTLAVRFGDRKAAAAAVVFYLLAVSLTPIPWFLNLVSIWFIPLAAFTDLGLASSSVLLLRDYSRNNARKIKNMVLFWLAAGLLAFIAGAVG